MNRFSPVVAGLLIGMLVLCVWSVPRPAHAILGVGDTVADFIAEVQTGITAGATVAQEYFSSSDNVKEYSLDPLAWMVAKIAIQSMTKSMVNWINSGFHGSPAFVSDLEGHLQIVGDAAAYGFLSELASNANINSPFRSQVVKAAALGYYAATSKNAYFQVNTYTLNRYTTNDKAFLAGDFSKGGWRAWLWATANPQNNPYGASIAIGDELNAQVTATKNKTMVQLNWGQGFLSWCGDATSIATTGGTAKDNNDVTPLTSGDQSGCTQKNGTPGQIQTPGSVIQSQINQTLGLTGDTLVTADEFDEIVGALMTQMVSQVMGSQGLRGVASVSSGGSGFIDKAADPSQISGIVSQSIKSTLAQSIASQIQKVTKYQTEWQTTGGAAGNAQTALTSCQITSDPGVTQQVSTVAAEAATANQKATTSLTALNKMQTELSAASDTDSASLSAVGAEFQLLLTSDTMPSAEELHDAELQSQDIGSNQTPTKFTQMKDVVSACASTTPTTSK